MVPRKLPYGRIRLEGDASLEVTMDKEKQ